MTDMISHDDLFVVLHRLVMRIEQDPIRYNKLIRFVSESDARGFTERYFQVSEMTLQQIGLGRDLEYFAREVAHQLVEMPESRK